MLKLWSSQHAQLLLKSWKLDQMFRYSLPHFVRYISNHRPMKNTTVHTLHWRHNDHHGVSNHQPHGCLVNRLFTGRSTKTSKLRVTLCGEFTGTGDFPAQMASNAENVSIWWRHHETPHTNHWLKTLQLTMTLAAPVAIAKTKHIIN